MRRTLISMLAVIAATVASYAGMSNSIEYTQVYIIGGAVSTGWDLGKSPRMSPIAHGVFEWDGELKGGEEFKFMNTTEAWHKHIVATTDNEVLREGEIHRIDFHANWTLPSELDRKFRVETTGRYRLTVDLVSMSICLSQPEDGITVPEKVYATGSALGGEVVELPLLHGEEFKAVLHCGAGNVVLMDTPQAGPDTKYIVPRFEDVDLTYGDGYKSLLRMVSEVHSHSGWSVSAPGDYTLYLRPSDTAYRARRFKPRNALYIVGGCCEKPWDYNDASLCAFRPNPQNHEELVWEGELRIGWNGNTEPDKFKILTAQNWTAETYHPYVENEKVGGTGYIRTSSGADSKWIIEKDGLYRLTVNTKYETLTTEYLSAVEPDGGEDVGVAAIDESAANPSVEMRCAGGAIELVYSPEPVEISVFDVYGREIAVKKGLLRGIVATGLGHGVYVISARGEAVSQSFKASL